MGIFLHFWILQQKAKLNEYLSTFPGGNSKNTTLGDTFDKYIKNPESRELFGAKIKKIALSAMIIPLSLSTNLFAKKFPKHEYLVVNTWHDATGLYRDEDWTWSMLPFSWRSIYLFFEMHPLLQKHHCSWVNYSDSIPCTHCNVTSLGYACDIGRHNRHPFWIRHCIHSSLLHQFGLLLSSSEVLFRNSYWRRFVFSQAKSLS